MKKEIYVVDCPTHIRFGDPMYFERFEGQKLERLVVDCKVPKNFVARVVLREQPIEGLPGENVGYHDPLYGPGTNHQHLHGWLLL